VIYYLKKDGIYLMAYILNSVNTLCVDNNIYFLKEPNVLLISVYVTEEISKISIKEIHFFVQQVGW